MRAAEKHRTRVRRAAITIGSVAAVAVIALVVTSIVLTSKPAAPPSAGSSSSANAEIRGLTTYSNTAGHVQGPVTYDQTPPAGGPHNAIWLNCGIYTEPVPNENAVHDLEHGAVWVTYDPSLPAESVSKLRERMPSTYSVLSPYPGLPAPIVLSAWNAQVTVSSVTDPRISQFFEKYRNSGNAPEPGAPCTGGLDAPGKL
ncbi:MAG: DUF3105 domain-containing protein [Candidatus Saccharibacteria bacterium]|nr:DUF3105 domain-containing protein [Microbacteriaceae bacterium]